MNHGLNKISTRKSLSDLWDYYELNLCYEVKQKEEVLTNDFLIQWTDNEPNGDESNEVRILSDVWSLKVLCF